MMNGFGIDKNKIHISVKFGAEREKRTRLSTLWPKRSSPVSQEIAPFTLQLAIIDDVIAGQIRCEEDQYLRSLKIQISLKKVKKHNYYATGDSLSPFISLKDEQSNVSLIAGRKNPLHQNVHFTINIRKGLLTIEWQFNRVLQKDTHAELDNVYLRMGDMKELLTKLTNDISRKYSSLFQDWDRTIWTISPETASGKLSVKKLEENLTVLENTRLFYQQIRLEGIHQKEGDWTTLGSDFNSRIGTLTRRIEHNGMTPCLAFSPLKVSPDSDVFKRHPEWLMRNLRDDLIPLLDISNPEVKNYLRECIKTIRDQWGFRALHLTGLSALQQPLIKKDNTFTSGDLQRETLQFFKENMGKNESLSTEGIPHLPGSGSIKIFDTFPAGLEKKKPAEAFRQIVIKGIQNAPLQKSLWIGNPGIFPCGSWRTKLPLQIRESLRQMILLSGGVLMTRVDHTELKEPELEELKSTFEAFEAFSRGKLYLIKDSGLNDPAILYNTAGKLGVFNLSGKTQSINLDLQNLRDMIGQKTGTYIKEGNTGMQTGQLDLILPPHGSRIFNF